MNEKKHHTLYRTYRPKDFDEVLGQPQVTNVLRASIENKKIAHAYLFCGSRGTGKTSVARILARALDVSDKDIYEIDAASNRGINEIRELREAVQTTPFESPYKFYIIDEAHMLTKEAWNAFLKTLEEPPMHVIFVLATTDREKVPDTIQSRCEIYTFKQPSREVLADVVMNIARKEGFTLQKPAAELVAMIADGSFRDALSVLQKVLAVSKNTTLDLEEVEKVTGAPRGELVRILLKALVEKDTPRALKAIGDAVEQTVDMKILARLLIQRLRVILLLRHAPDLAVTFGSELAPDDMILTHELAQNPGATSDLIKSLLESHAQISYAALPHLPLELVVVDTANLNGPQK